MIAITQAADYLRAEAGDRHRGSLEKASLYATLEPCAMCMGAMIQASVERVVFACFDPKAGACGTLYDLSNDKRLNHRIKAASGVMEKEARGLLKGFFSGLRRKKAGTP